MTTAKNVFITNQQPEYNTPEMKKILKMGDYTNGTPLMRFKPGCTIEIGKYCSLANESSFEFASQHRTDFVSTYPFQSFKDIWTKASHIPDASFAVRNTIVVRNEVWIGTGAKILGGVYIDNGAVIGAHAIVTGHIPPYAIVVGNPAKVIRYRFDENTIEALLEIKWWDWPEEKVAENAHLLASPDIREFIEKFA